MDSLSFKLMRYASLFSFTRWIGTKMTIIFKQRNPLEDHQNSYFNIKDVDLMVNDIRQNGFSRKFSVTQDCVNELIDFCKSTTFKDVIEDKEFKIDYQNPIKPISKGLWYQNLNAYNSCSIIKNLAHNYQVLSIARQYLGAEPIIKSVAVWWSFPPADNNYSPEYGFHYDIDAYKFLKFFIYLVDVDEKTGPHTIIPGTHKSKSFFEKKNRRLTDEQVEEHYKGKPVTILGKTGEGFFEDTFTYHKGNTPLKPRLMLQVEYSI